MLCLKNIRKSMVRIYVNKKERSDEKVRTLEYFYKYYLSPCVETCVEFCEKLGEYSKNLFLIIGSWLLGIALFFTLPLWIIPYKINKDDI